MTPFSFTKSLANISFANAFNPYRDCCPQYDYFDAAAHRRSLLRNMLIAAQKVDVDAIWIGRDLGYLGGRRTGLALTDDVHYADHASRWGLDVKRTTKGSAVPERTANYVWRLLDNINQPIFMWNVFPLHPHLADMPFTNRSHNAHERDTGIQVLAELVDLLKPKRIIAIGNDADIAANKLGINPIKVRHPSYGGQSQFLQQMRKIY
ncbi:uracil-DNA glycosylase [Paraferrimonas sp. SM1919]|uniref:uracil-DNA glycosylase n=1 Tax=Paraferrimonas sp. SM1919 TaxID=2662263 RepID=UPI0013D5A487|nr:uracil-DNA glycosylase [Paraferrimonas sp. SM1919]